MSKVKKSVQVNAPVELVYGAWRNFENFPHFMGNIEEVRVTSSDRSHWKAKGPLGVSAEWDAEITLDEANRALGWRSIEGSGVETAGRVNFNGMGEQTAIDVTIEYDAPGGIVGTAVTKIFSNPEQQVEDDLMSFKETMEKGFELSGMTMHGQAADASYGGSMGGATDADLARITDASKGVDEPTA